MVASLYVVYSLFGGFVFFMCDSYVCVVQRRCNLTCDLHAFELGLVDFNLN